ncbi:hypothetical protein LR004_01250, partial [Candidatus Gracilibacteria bacterium]|nr:hypothetical protein [Candidatus Gracilibacteria bacterium]
PKKAKVLAHLVSLETMIGKATELNSQRNNRNQLMRERATIAEVIKHIENELRTDRANGVIAINY